MSELPRVISFAGEDVYAPVCHSCDSDEHTKWVGLNGSLPHAFCYHCETTTFPSRADVHRAHEPRRLAARLAELLREVEADTAKRVDALLELA